MTAATTFDQAISVLFAHGDFPGARKLLEPAIAAAPGNARLHWQLGTCHAAAGNQLHLAHDCFRESVRLEPGMATAHASLGAWYFLNGIVDLALASSATAMALAPQNPRIVVSHARILEAAGQIDSAWSLARQLIDGKFITPGSVRLYGRIARYRGDQTTALNITLGLLHGGSLQVSERAAMDFTAADLLDSLGRYDEAFTHAAAGNAAIRPRYDPAAHARTFDRFIAWFTHDRIRSLARSKIISAKPIFIVGMPRSGTSLVEQILASHPDIHGAGELDFMERVFHGTVAMLGANANDYPECLEKLTPDQAIGMGQIYRQPLIALSPSSQAITDKLPLNFLHLGLINLLLPGARIIHCRRDPMDTCLSCHMNSFTAGNDFKFDLVHAGLFHRQYQRLMAHWRGALDLQMLDVSYEDLVAHPENETRRLLQFLSLPYDPACLDFHQTTRPVLTSSLQQVRQPFYAISIHRWKHYEKHLGPLKAALGTTADGYSPAASR
jgi:tetratricopeptide (TPR) repeat protein